MEQTEASKIYGTSRHVDNLGRIVIPKDMRIAFDLNSHDAVEIIPMNVKDYGKGVFVRSLKVEEK